MDSAIGFPNTYPLDSDFYPVDSAIQRLNNPGQKLKLTYTKIKRGSCTFFSDFN